MSDLPQDDIDYVHHYNRIISEVSLSNGVMPLPTIHRQNEVLSLTEDVDRSIATLQDKRKKLYLKPKDFF